MQDMKHPVTKSTLSPARARIVTLMQKVGFGTIDGLHVRGGEPSYTPPPRIVHEIKFVVSGSALKIRNRDEVIGRLCLVAPA